MKIYMVRHGQSEANAKKQPGGWEQTHLTEKGRADAAIAGKRLEGISFDKVYSSDLFRTIETQQIALPDAEAERCTLIREIDVGCLAGKLAKDCEEKYGPSYLVNKSLLDFADYGGEDHQQFRERICEFLKILEASPYENVAVFCHGGVIRTMIDIVTGVDIVNKFTSFKCTNCGVYIFEYDGKRWCIDTWNYRGDIQ